MRPRHAVRDGVPQVRLQAHLLGRPPPRRRHVGLQARPAGEKKYWVAIQLAKKQLGDLLGAYLGAYLGAFPV